MTCGLELAISFLSRGTFWIAKASTPRKQTEQKEQTPYGILSSSVATTA
jgi:hypothetical protein